MAADRGEATGAFCPGPYSAGGPKDQYTLIEQSNTLLKQSSYYGEGPPTFISCPEPLKFSRRPCVPLNTYSDLLQSQCTQ